MYLCVYRVWDIELENVTAVWASVFANKITGASLLFSVSVMKSQLSFYLQKKNIYIFTLLLVLFHQKPVLCLCLFTLWITHLLHQIY